MRFYLNMKWILQASLDYVFILSITMKLQTLEMKVNGGSVEDRNEVSVSESIFFSMVNKLLHFMNTLNCTNTYWHWKKICIYSISLDVNYIRLTYQNRRKLERQRIHNKILPRLFAWLYFFTTIKFAITSKSYNGWLKDVYGAWWWSNIVEGHTQTFI